MIVFCCYDITDKCQTVLLLRIFEFSPLGKGRDVFRNANASLHVSKDTRQRQALLYVKEKKIHDIIEFLFGNLLLRRPNDPYEYLKELLDKYILFRSGLVDTPFAFPFHSK